jgi:hypothetical protein
VNYLASQAAVVGSLPEALALRERAENIHRRLGDTLLLPYDITNRAEVLIKLGRFDDASQAMTEVDVGIGKKIDSYLSRVRRIAYLRALSATLNNQFAQASSLIAAVPKSAAPSPTSTLVSALDGYVRARLGHKVELSDNPTERGDPATRREREYWMAATALARKDTRNALAVATSGIEHAKKIGNDELAWRTAAIGAAAARAAGDREQERVFRALAAESRARLRISWGTQASRYEQRPDLIELRKASELED